jgi:thiamine biosynthesis protein ThiS
VDTHKVEAETQNKSSLSITVNGETRPAPAGLCVVDLLHQLGLNGGRVAIERNRHILPRPKWQETQLQDGDVYEIVQFVGGG